MEHPWTKEWGGGEAFGAGGQGDTLLLPDGTAPKAVLKILKDKKKHDAKARRRMYQEVSNLRIMSAAGANVPRVLESNSDKFAEEGTELYLIMEHISGETLARLVACSPNISLETSVKICLKLCQTLRIAIQEKIVHRDLKPENVIVRDLESFDVVMLDFGISFRQTE